MGLLEKSKSYLAKRKEAQVIRLLDKNVSPSGKRFLSLFGANVNALLQKEDRSVVREAVTRYSDLIEPTYDPYELLNLYETHWVVRMCVDKLVRETTRQGWKFEPAYEVKCETCETEYDYVPLSGKCPACVPPKLGMETESTTANTFAKAFPPTAGPTSATTVSTTVDTEGTAAEIGTLAPPDPKELERVQEFLDHPNKDGLTTEDILKRAIRDLLIFDDFYVSVHLRKDIEGPYWKRLQWSPEDARMIAIQADVKGRLGGKTFCQVCELEKTPGSQTFLYAQEDAGSTCPNCKQGKLTEMAYAQRKGSAPVAAWSKDEIIHGNLWAVGSKLFGTPKLWAVQTQVVAMSLMDKFQKDTFDKAKTPKNIFLVKGVTPDSLRSAQRQFEQAKLIDPMADMWIAAPIAPGGGQSSMGIEKIPSLDPPIIENSIAYQEFAFKNICYTFGISPSAIGMETSGKLGSSQAGAEQRDVTPETINEIQKQSSEVFDKNLKRFFTEFKNWYFKLDSAHEDEEAREWTVKKLQLETAKIAVDAGFDVMIDEDGTPKISGAGKRPEPTNPFGGPINEDGESAATAASKPPFGKTLKKLVTTEDLEKASKFQFVIRQAAKEYKTRLDAFAERIFSRLQGDMEDVLGAKTPDNHATPDLKMALLERATRILDESLEDGEKLAIENAQTLYRVGVHAASQEMARVAKQDTPDEAAIEAHRKRTIEAMRNALYFGDKDSYLTKISQIMDQGIENNWTTDQLARELQKQLDPDKEHFSDYMWERIARTESATYVIQGRIDAYTEFGIPMLKRIVASDAIDNLCAPFSGAIYRVEDADAVIPAHPNCRCAFAPYYGPEEPIDSFEILRNY